MKPVPQVCYLGSRHNWRSFSFLVPDTFMTKGLLTDSILLAFSFEVIFASNISKLLIIELFVRFIEGSTIFLGCSTSMMNSSRMRHNNLMKLGSLLLGKLVSLIKLLEEILIGSFCATTADIFLLRYQPQILYVRVLKPY